LRRRIQLRDRPFERGISNEYLEALQSHYDRWISSVDFCPVVRVETNNSNITDPNIVRKIADDLASILKSRQRQSALAFTQVVSKTLGDSVLPSAEPLGAESPILK